jgi:hypothetical protein
MWFQSSFVRIPHQGVPMADLGIIDWSHMNGVLIAQAGPPTPVNSTFTVDNRIDTAFPENGANTIPDGCTHYHNISTNTTYGTTLNFPMNPIEGQSLLITTIGNIQALALNGNGRTIHDPAAPEKIALARNGNIAFRYNAAHGWVTTQYNPSEINASGSSRTYSAYGSSGFKWTYPNSSYDIYADPGNFWMQGTNAGTLGRPISLKITLQSTLNPDDIAGTDYRDTYMGLDFSMVNVSGRWGSGDISTLTSSGGVATATTASTTGMVVGQVVVISGATPAAYNGTVKITRVVNSTQFTYQMTTPTTEPCTGAVKWTATGDRPLALGLVTVPSNTRAEGTNQTWPNFGTGVGAHVLSFTGGPLRIGRSGATGGFEMMKFDDITGNTTLFKAYANVSEQRETSSTSFMIANNLTHVVLAGSGMVRVVMPSAPTDGQIVNLSLETSYTYVAIAANAGQTIVIGPPMCPTAGCFASFRYRAANKKWLRVG